MTMLTNFAENKLVDFLWRGQALGLSGASAGAGSGPSTWWVALFTAAPSDSGAGTEVSGGSYARIAVASTMANWAGTQGAGSTAASSGSSGSTSNNIVLTFPAPTANWGTAVSFGLFDAASGGNLGAYGSLSAPRTVNVGDAAPSFAAGSMILQIDN